MNLKTKLSLGALLISILPVLGVSVLAYVSASNTLNNQVFHGLASITKERLSDVEHTVGRAATDIETWSKLLILQDVLTDDEEGDAGDELARLQKQFQYFTELVALNDKGIVVASSRRESIGLVLSATPAYQATREGATYQSTLIEHSNYGDPAIILAKPIFAEYAPGTVIGAVIGYLEWAYIENTLAAATILGSRQDAAHRLILTASTQNAVLYDSISDPAADEEISIHALPRRVGVLPVHLPGKDYLVGTAVTSGYQVYANPFWTMQALVSNEAAFAEVWKLRERIIGLTLAVAAIVILTATLVARSLIRPLAGLEKAAGKLATGNFTTPLPEQRSDEIGSLTSSFESMRNAILKHRNQLLNEVEEHKKTELNLERSKKKLEQEALVRERAEEEALYLSQILEESTNELYIFDAHSLLFLKVNKGAADNSGYSRSELHSMSPLDLKPEYTRATFEELVAPLKSGQNQELLFDTIHQRKNGTTYPVQIHLQLFANARPPMFVALVTDISERKNAERRIRDMAYTDSLTGIYNRNYFLQHLEDTIKRSVRHESHFALLFLDLDGFKDINDSLGHDAGDELLVAVADRLKGTLRDDDFIARLGGDEFCILIDEISDEDSAAKAAAACLSVLNKPFELVGRTLRPRGSIGIAVYPDDAGSVQELLKSADSAMYAAKTTGKHRYAFYNQEMGRMADQRLRLEHELRHALDNSEFDIHYQPQISTLGGRLVAVEALARWNHPTRGTVSPIEFIPVLERMGLIQRLGNWVLNTAAAQHKAWAQQGMGNIRLAVNVSPLQFSDGSVIDSVTQLLSSTDMRPDLLELEITESVIQTEDRVVSTLKDLKMMGVKIAIDDFGTGYSCLASLKSLSLDTLKIDRLFVNDILENPESSMLCGTIIGMAQAMGYEVVAEGVEKLDQARSLVGFNCDFLQGYYFSRPVKAAEIPGLANIDFRQKLNDGTTAKTA